MSIQSAPGRIFTLSAMTLFLEMLVIRLVASEIRIFAYVSNLLLVLCFFCLGWGYLIRMPPGRALRRSGLCVLGLFVVLYLPFDLGALEPRAVTQYLSHFQDFAIWFGSVGRDRWAVARDMALGLGIVTVLAALMLNAFAPLSSLIGQLFVEAGDARLGYYSLNIVGSMVGVALANGVSLLHWKPYHWLAALALLYLIAALQWRRDPLRRRDVAVGLALVMAAAAVIRVTVYARNRSANVVWSTYHRVDIAPSAEAAAAFGEPARGHFYNLGVNGAFIMGIYDLSPKYVHAHLRIARLVAEHPPHFDFPYLLAPSVRDVLIVGAGSGNDVAAALRHGAGRVDAVEIDDEFVRLGRAYHPEQPYASDRVHVVIDDARSFLQHTDRLYDMRDSFLAGTSCAMIFLGARDMPALDARVAAATDPAVGVRRRHATRLFDRLDRVDGMTDDWPFLQLWLHRVPNVYLALYGLMIVLACGLLGSRLRGVPARMAVYFCFGLSFMLLETHIVTRSALLFGSTWITFSYVTMGILTCILASNQLVMRNLRAPETVLYGLLAVGLLANFAVPVNRFLPLLPLARTVGFLALATWPILCAGVLFARYFDTETRPDQALGINLIGALVGGMLESLSFVFGLRMIVLLALAFYMLAAVSRRVTGPH